jgi:hypothetical protein
MMFAEPTLMRLSNSIVWDERACVILETIVWG